MLYSIKMRASKNDGGFNKHISGAERIIMDEQIIDCSKQLISRAMKHSKGKPDYINLKMEEVKEEKIIRLESLKVRTVETKNYEEGRKKVLELLELLGISKGKEILKIFDQVDSLRGAVILDINTLERLEPDKERGVRATNMDSGVQGLSDAIQKNHYKEAIVLATKVANAPNIIGEICVSDDPDYVTGYVASQQFGYVRITNMKKAGSDKGGRIFLYDGDKNELYKTINFLEKQYVLVDNIVELKESGKEPLDKKWKEIDSELKELKACNLYRKMKTISSAQNKYISLNNQDMLMLSSNSYLDLANEKVINEYAKKILEQYGTGSGGSRLTTGNTKIHEKLEQVLSEFLGTEAALVFNSGYMANLATISTLCSSKDIIFSDELNHASIIDGCRLSKAELIIYKHNDMRDLEEKVKLYRGKKGMIVSDAVFSMGGDIVNLPELLRIADQYGLFSMVDEAHALGVIGKTGRGVVEYYGLKQKPDIIMGTLSKAIGSEGGFVCGNQMLIEYLKNKARGFIYTTALSPVTIAASVKAIELIKQDPRRVLRLQENIAFFEKCLKKKGIEVEAKSAIVPVVIGDEEKAMEISEKLLKMGYFISAIRYPTVKKGEAILRITIMSTHTYWELENVANKIAALL